MANNVIKRLWNQNRMVTIEDLKGMTFQQEVSGHTFEITGVDDAGNIIALSGTPSGVLLRADDQEVALTCSVSDGKVYATIPANGYAVPGKFGLTVFLTASGQTTALYAAIGSVNRTASGVVAPPAGSDVATLINQINAAIAAIPVNYNASFAPAYSTSGLYAVGQYVTQNGGLYRCITPVTTAGTWEANSSKFTAAALGTDVSALKRTMADGMVDIWNINLSGKYEETWVVGGINSEDGQTIGSQTDIRIKEFPEVSELYAVTSNKEFESGKICFYTGQEWETWVGTIELSGQFALCVAETVKKYYPTAQYYRIVIKNANGDLSNASWINLYKYSKVEVINEKTEKTSHGVNVLPIEKNDTKIMGVTRNYENGKIVETGTKTGTGGGIYNPISPVFWLEPGRYRLFLYKLQNGEYVTSSEPDIVVRYYDIDNPENIPVIFWPPASNGGFVTVSERIPCCVVRVGYTTGTTYNETNYAQLAEFVPDDYYEPSVAHGYDKNARERIAALEESQGDIPGLEESLAKKVNFPLDAQQQVDYGTLGNVLKTNGDGTTEWVPSAQPTEEQMMEAISEWMDDHPELMADKGYATPEMYGAAGDGTTDDTQAIQDAINSSYRLVVLTKNYKVKVKEEDYGNNKGQIIPALELTGTNQIINKTILFANATIQLEYEGNTTYEDGGETKPYKYYILDINGDNVALIGKGVLIGTRFQTGMTNAGRSDFDYGISIDSPSKNILIDGITVKDCWSDGICIEGSARTNVSDYCKDIIIRNVTVDNNCRNGISVVSAEGVLIDNCFIYNSCKNTQLGNGVGIDCEANGFNDRLNNIVISNCVFSGNRKNSINVYGRKNESGDDIECNVIVSNCILDGAVTYGAEGQHSSLEMSNCKITPEMQFSDEPETVPFVFQLSSKYTDRISISDCTVDCSNNPTGILKYAPDTDHSNITIKNLMVMNGTIKRFADVGENPDNKFRFDDNNHIDYTLRDVTILDNDNPWYFATSNPDIKSNTEESKTDTVILSDDMDTCYPLFNNFVIPEYNGPSGNIAIGNFAHGKQFTVLNNSGASKTIGEVDNSNRKTKLVQRLINGKFASMSADSWNWGYDSGVTYSIYNNVATIVTTSQDKGIYAKIYASEESVVNDIYLVTAYMRVSSDVYDNKKVKMYVMGPSGDLTSRAVIGLNTKWVPVYALFKEVNGSVNRYVAFRTHDAGNTTFQLAKAQCYNLTKMFGSNLANMIYDQEMVFYSDTYSYAKTGHLSLFRNIFYKDYYEQTPVTGTETALTRTFIDETSGASASTVSLADGKKMIARYDAGERVYYYKII